jgi:RimJ/RimL family protein N-acetyltransferase
MPGSRFLDGETVALHAVARDDLPWIADAVNRPDVRRPLGDVHARTLDDQEAWYDDVVQADDQLRLLVVADGDRVGLVSLSNVDPTNGHAHLGYWIHADHRRQGYARDAVTAVLGHGFAERRLRTVVAHVYAFNDASVALLESLGFEQTGRYPDWEYHDGEHHDDLVYAITRDAWGS